MRLWNVLVVIGILFMNSCGLVPTAQTRGERGAWIVDTRVEQNTKKSPKEVLKCEKSIVSKPDPIFQIPKGQGLAETSNRFGNKGKGVVSEPFKISKIQSQKSKSIRPIKILEKELKRPLNKWSFLKKNLQSKPANRIPSPYSDSRKTWISVGFFLTFFGTMLVIGLTGMEELLLLDTIMLLLLGVLFAELFLCIATDTLEDYLASVNVIFSLVGLGILTLVGMIMILEEGYELGVVMEIFAYTGWILLLVVLLVAYADM